MCVQPGARLLTAPHADPPGRLQLQLRPDRTPTVRAADGTRLLHLPAAPFGDPDELPDVSAGTLRSGESDQRLDLDHAVHVLLVRAA